MSAPQTVVAFAEPWRRSLVGRSPAMERLAEKIRLIGPKRATVLITGETGTGKEAAARAIHAAGPRAHLPMVAVNCTALPEPLLEAELFGHVRGAFTGAVQSRAGRFEQANHGTLFLDEIGDMPMDTQAKLLRVLQEREFQRIGSSETIHIDVRVLAATNADLPRRIAAGRFREDLYYRLNVVPLPLPPLRERLDDIPALAAHFTEKICLQEGIPVRRIASETIEMLRGYSWPGNVRQLENAIEHAIALGGDRMALFPSDFHLPLDFSHRAAGDWDSPHYVAVPDEGLDFEATIGRIELHILEQALRRTGGNKSQAAEILRLKRTTLTAKLRSLYKLAQDCPQSPLSA
ncbi:MAG: sigma-54-dependent Fis family transcriptional regulator [Bryobacterales bacterium]|nr:sigma-54-dependent Fis family transcriptional regulator [Bryobacterales bacterium]